jgi:hypothetical protein
VNVPARAGERLIAAASRSWLRPMSGAERGVLVVALLLVLTGTTVRLAPLASDQRTVAAITEDGYLMLTVARNVALGRGLTIAEGTIATNGVQPAVTFAWAAAHRATGSERMLTLRAVIILQWAVALVTAILVMRLARHALAGQPWGDAGAMFAGALWFASPLALRHTSNGLETGPYALAIATVLLVDQHWRLRSVARALGVGAMLGALFLVRNDAAFLIGAWGLLELKGERGSPSPFGRRLTHAVLAAIAALAVASPWLIYNARVFGHVVPISGRAQNLNTALGENLLVLPRVLAEYAWMVTPLPRFDGSSLAALALFGLLAALVAATCSCARRTGVSLQRWMVLLLIHGGLLAAYYGVFFGAAYFLSRYLFPLSLIAVLGPVLWVFAWAGGRAARGVIGMGAVLIASGLALVAGIAAWRFHAGAATHDHAQVVQWVAEHATPGTWIGAPQSGTLGYFHDRTVNLDGKVNPLALRARRENRLFQYIVHETKIEYIVDWYGLARWIDRPDTVQEEADPDVLRRHFTVVVRDPARNIFVLRRTAAASARR